MTAWGSGLLRDERLLAAALSGLPEAVLVTDAPGAVVYVNEAFTALTGYTASDLLPDSWYALHGPETAEEDIAAILDARRAGRPYRGRILHYRKDGHPFWCGLSLAPMPGPDGRASFFVGVMRDISDRVVAQTQLVQMLQETRQAHETANNLLRIAGTLPQARSTGHVAEAVAASIPELTGADRSAVALWSEAEGHLAIAAVHGWDGPLRAEAAAFTVRPTDLPELARMLEERRGVLVDRASASAWSAAALVRFGVTAFAAFPVVSGGALRGLLLAYWTDTPGPAGIDGLLGERLSGLAGITSVALDNARLLEEARHLADHDPLTEVGNRAALMDSLTLALQGRGEDERVAVVFCDIDHLKRINDSMGHSAGDRILREAARRIRSILTGDQFVARIGGDEFVVVLPHVRSEAEVGALTDRLRREIALPLKLDGRRLTLQLSTGVAIAGPEGEGRAWDADAALRAADHAMYEQKGLRAGTSGANHRPLTRDLVGALAQDQITAVFQPIVDLAHGRVVGIEALARWDHPELGQLAPDRFIPLAELTGHVHAIGRRVLRHGCELLTTLDDDFPHLELSINVSAAELSANLAEDVLAGLAECRLAPSRLTLEITESVLVDDHLDAAAQLRRLHVEGVRIALDDFGTGYTGIGRLRDLPVTELKIDRSFLRPREVGRPDLLAALVGLAHALDVRAVAEGVETVEQDRRLRRLRCDRAQGYLYGRPMTAEDLTSALRGRT